MKAFVWKTILITARAKCSAVCMPYIHLSTFYLRGIKTLHYSLMYAHLIYGIQLWDNAYNKYIGKLEIAKSENCSNGIRSSVILVSLAVIEANNGKYNG